MRSFIIEEPGSPVPALYATLYTHTIQQEQQSKWTFKANFPKSKHVVFVPTIDAECSGKYSHGAMLLKMQPQSYANNIYRRTCVRPLGDAL